jgi:hypothetical protein
MRGKKTLSLALVAAAATASLSLFVAQGAWASGRPGGQPVTASGTGTLGSPWTLKSMHDDLNGAQIVGEEFEIFPVNGVGQTWTITFADNGVVFFTGTDVATATGIREVHSTANQPGTQHMTAHAVNQNTGEMVDGAVDLPPLA